MLQLLVSISIFLSTVFVGGLKQNIPKTSENQNVLKTGWYYISSQKTACLRKLDQGNEDYYLNSEPIVAVNNFASVEMKGGSYGNYILFRFNTAGTIAWSNATGSSIGKKLALVVDNKLIYTPQINAQITSGISALNKGSYTDVQLKSFLKQIKLEMQR